MERALVGGAHPTEREELGTSVLGREIGLWRFNVGGGDPLLIHAAIHGDEPATTYVARRLMRLLEDGVFSDANGRGGGTAGVKLMLRREVAIVPVVNPDGLAHRMRHNARWVDLNRNFPARNWRYARKYGPNPASEPETRALMAAVEQVQPGAIIAMHQITRWRYCNNYNGPAVRLAQLLRRYNSYPALDDIGYPTPGSFGSWAGLDQGYPVITLEMSNGITPEVAWRQNERGLLAVLGAGDLRSAR